MTITHTPKAYGNLEKAIEIAEKMQANDPDWTYKIFTSEKNGFSIIKVYDEDGEYVATL
jgi:hypothetical protein